MLATKIKNLNLAGSFSAFRQELVDQLYEELGRAGISLRPKVYLADEWFSPDDAPIIAVPFYLACPELTKLAKKHIGSIEGETQNDFMRLLRHECGHAVETAYNLKYSRIRQKTFGLFSAKYPDRYCPNLGSMEFVEYLGDGYAQAHPCEDFAETFAYYLEWGVKAEDHYPANSGAQKKLIVMSKMMKKLKDKKPVKKSFTKLDSYKTLGTTLEDFFSKRRKALRVDERINFFKQLPSTEPRFDKTRSDKAYLIFEYELKKRRKNPLLAANTLNYTRFVEKSLHYFDV